MNRNSKQATVLSVILLVAALLAAFSVTFTASAQTSTDATVVIVAGDGGTTSPVPGTYTYPDGQVITLQATANTGFAFHYWVITGEVTPGHEQSKTIYVYDPVTGESLANYTFPATPTAADSLIITTASANITCGYGYTFEYAAVFTPVSGTQTPAPTSTPTNTTAVVIVDSSTGGTVSPAPGTYVYNQGQNITLTATPSAGYAFHYWVVSGNYAQGHEQASVTAITDPDTGAIIGYFPSIPQRTGIDNLVFANNPATITCGYGYTFEYQAVFTPISSTSPTPAPTTAAPTTAAPTTIAPTAAPADMTTTYIIVAVVVIVIIIIVVVAAMMMRKKK
jgi:hypothetical protein